ncbi:type VII secretion-associated serine protease mycosin [Streptomyces sp. 8L]|uniref:type VII secretion-associated serine protease mycosin n=1 Tax=Streptomyces sp. 8L TaxID=2877242 RepID=UPI001CD29D3B|nr:type VII secretion-associated serine protease mycosin [Streptomyces sp. 8L]MCA1218308.1 type VII secretion-associated serine protease mycosin [Streptomyces sp. 8L]
MKHRGTTGRGTTDSPANTSQARSRAPGTAQDRDRPARNRAARSRTAGRAARAGRHRPAPSTGTVPLTRAALLASAAALTALVALPPAAAGAAPPTAQAGSTILDGSGECTFPMKKQTPGTPWPLQRVLFDELWKDTKGKGVRVAVIDTGVDIKNPQLKDAVDAKAGKDFLGKTHGTTDTAGHGTKVAGLIAARPRAGTGFVGIAPESTIIPIRQNDEKGSGDSDKMALAIRYAVAQHADIINISQDTTAPLGLGSKLAEAVRYALDHNVVVVAAAGNDGTDGQARDTYPAAFPGVLAVAASDRDNERAAFSQPGSFVGVAAPGVDIVSTVPGNGQCLDNGTSFSAPYVAGVAALLRAEHRNWSVREIVAQIEQTAERSVNGHDNFVGWGVVDPVAAVGEGTGPIESPRPDPGPPKAPAPQAARLTLGETPQDRGRRYATYTLGIAVVLVAVVGGTAVVLRDSRAKARGRAGGGPGGV